ncbi:Uncharacterised protein [Klebsiella grimontii]|nr:Uncharacterised protein [Klebsiella grimontii]
MGSGAAPVIHCGRRQRHITFSAHAEPGWRDDIPPADVQVSLRLNVTEGDFSGRRQGNVPLSGCHIAQVDADPGFGGDQADFTGIHAAKRLCIDSKLRLCTLTSNGFYRAILKADPVRSLSQGEGFRVNFAVQFSGPADDINIFSTGPIQAVTADNHRTFFDFKGIERPLFIKLRFARRQSD